MEVTLGLVAPATGARAEVAVSAATGTPLAAVRDALVEAVLPGGAHVGLWAGGRALGSTDVLGAPPLVDGALVHVGAPPAAEGAGPVALALHGTGGPDAGLVQALVPGTVVLGRGGSGASVDVTVADPDVSRQHCRLLVGHRGEVRVEDLGSTNGTTVDGAPVTGPTPLPVGAVLQLGSSRFVLAPGAAPTAPLAATGDGLLAYNRPPRVRPPHPVVQVVVPAPPTEGEKAPLPLLLVLAPVVVGLVLWRVMGNATFLLFTLLSPVMALGSFVSDRRAGRRRSRRERALWQAPREVAETTLHRAVRDDERRRREADPDPAAVLLTATGPGPRLWERRRGEDSGPADDVLRVRVGVAALPAEVEADGDLAGLDTLAHDVPVVVPLLTVGVLGVAGPLPRARALARWLVVQAAVHHSPRDLELVVLAETSAAPEWAWVRWLPHVRPQQQDCRALVGVGTAQAAARVAELATLVAARRGRVDDERRVLVVVDGARALRGVPGLAALLRDGPAVGVHAVTVESDPRLLPEESGATAVVTGDVGTLLDVAVAGAAPVRGVAADLVSVGYAERVARALAPLRDDSRDREGSLPDSVRWTDVTRLPLDGSPDDVAAVLDRWAAPGRSTEAVLGRGPDGVFAVDLRRDGPHALIAGTTGSGKSELLQTLVASLALGNRPDELSLVLVDYKGGAAFGPCAQLPHVVGVVTDLDGLLVERALASLTAELTRREAVLADAGALDVDEHRRRVGRPDGPRVPLPRLVIVVDEFASLAAELPEFVDGLVGIAQRGRSLGVHLVLATQRPEGVVSADVRANTNLRLCLAVTRETESRDVLDSPVAANISRTTPGRGWARTGATELTAFQAARIGGPRPGAVVGEPAVAVVPFEELGEPRPRRVTEHSDDSDLALLVAACRTASDRLALATPRRPWLAPLPTAVTLDALPAADDPLAGRPGRVPPLPWGMLDVPSRQRQEPVALDLDRGAHLLVVGQPRSGRTTLLRTLAGSVARTASPDDVHLYVLDLGGGLAGLAALPHTGAVVPRDAADRTDRLLTWLGAEVSRRQALLAEAGVADVGEQRAAAPVDQRLPHLLLLLDRWEAFLAAYADLDAGRLVDAVLRLLREGPSAGLHVVVTADRSGLVGRIGTLVEERLLLRLPDRGDYAGAGIPSRSVPADLPAGRGLHLPGPPLQAQVALLTADPSGPAQGDALARLAARVPAGRRGPRRVEVLPLAVPLESLSRPARGVVLGVGGDELAPVAVELDAAAPGLVVGGPPGSGRSTALRTLAAGLAERGRRVVAVAPRPSRLRELPGCVTAATDLAGLQAQLLDDADRLCPGVLLVDDAELLVDSPLAPLLERAVREGRDAGLAVVAAGTTDDLVTGFRGFVVELRRARTGVLLSPQGPADGDLLGVRLSRAVSGTTGVVPGRGVLVLRGELTPVQVALPPAGRSDDAAEG